MSSSYLNSQRQRNIGLGVRNLQAAAPPVTAFIKEAQEQAKELSFKLFNSYQSTYKPD